MFVSIMFFNSNKPILLPILSPYSFSSLGASHDIVGPFSMIFVPSPCVHVFLGFLSGVLERLLLAPLLNSLVASLLALALSSGLLLLDAPLLINLCVCSNTSSPIGGSGSHRLYLLHLTNYKHQPPHLYFAYSLTCIINSVSSYPCHCC